MDFNKCFICKNSSEIKPLPMHIDAYRLSCPICGTYEITGAAAINIDSIHHDLIHILSAVARLASEHKTPIRISAENLEELINSAQVPDGPLEMIDKILLYTSRKSKTFNELVKLRSNDYPICFSRNGEEFFFLCNRACDIGYMEYINNHYRLRLDGWKRISELKKLKPDSKRVFVAMWFDNKTTKLREAIKSGVTASGYIPIIADESDYTGNIMDFVLGSIKQSKFVVADFTCEPEKIDNHEGMNELIRAGVRGGVYYEAGYAKGIGLEVIHLCRDDIESKKRLHFDVEQENTIFWTDKDVEDITVRKIEERESNISPKNLSEKLFDRIIRIFGYGPIKMD